MQLAAHRISFHADADQVIRAEQVESLLFGQGHGFPEPLKDSNGQETLVPNV